tara:strand:- start:44 stop:454 length:411 start_codon:yes stop_codon:yes gene_type:complete
MKKKIIEVTTSGEQFYDITDKIRDISLVSDGTLQLFLPHTSCALCISEAFDPSAISDVNEFMKNLAPRDLNFITHTAEGPDDSPSHMKSVLLQQSISIFVEEGKIVLGQWQGIYLAEFRDGQHLRKVYYKYIPDPV